MVRVRELGQVERVAAVGFNTLLCKRNHAPGAGKESIDCKGNMQIGARATENDT